jgi:hypothetical protein
MAEESNVRFIGAAKRQIRTMTKRGIFHVSIPMEVIFDEADEAYAFPEKSLAMDGLLQDRPEYHELSNRHRERAKKTKVYSGAVCEMYWFEDTLYTKERLMPVWAIRLVGRPTLMQLAVGGI